MFIRVEENVWTISLDIYIVIVNNGGVVTYAITINILTSIVVPVVVLRSIIPQIRRVISHVFVPVDINEVTRIKSTYSNLGTVEKRINQIQF